MVTAVSSATTAPANSYAVQTARREAQQAEQTAQNLQVQAENLNSIAILECHIAAWDGFTRRAHNPRATLGF